MPIIRAMRLLNSIEGGTLNAASLETLLADAGRLSELQVLVGLRGQCRRMGLSDTTMTAVSGSGKALTAFLKHGSAIGHGLNRLAVLGGRSHNDPLAGLTTLEQIAGSSAAITDVVATSSIRSQIFADTALSQRTLAKSTFTDAVIANSTALAALVASSTAMGAVVASPSAMATMVASSAAMDAIAGSATARAAIGTAGVAFDAIAGSSMAIAKYVAGHAGLIPSSYATIASVTSSATAMDAIAVSNSALTALSGSSTAIASAVASATAMNSLAASATARTFIGTGGVPTALYTAIAASHMATAKMLAGHAGLAPSSYASTLTIYNTDAAMTAIQASTDALTFAINSSIVGMIERDTDTAAAAMTADAGAPVTVSVAAGLKFITLAWAVEATAGNNYTLATVRSGTTLTGVHTGMPLHGATTVGAAAADFASVKSLVLGSLASAKKVAPLADAITSVSNNATARVLNVIGIPAQ